jgi:Mn-dependent DtxR family transcriptional regulator
VKVSRHGDLTKLLDAVIGSKKLTKSDRSVLMQLIRNSRWNGTATVPKEAIAENLQIDPKTVQRAYRALEREKLIDRQVLGHNGDGKNHPTRYRLCEALLTALL